MSRRFGRNQRRQMREQIQTLERERVYDRRRCDEAIAEMEARIIQATTDGEWVKVDLASMLNLEDRSLTIRADFENRRRQTVHAAYNLEPRIILIRDDRARRNFMLNVGQAIAKFGLEQMIKHFGGSNGR